jgi:hypothetical protein
MEMKQFLLSWRTLYTQVSEDMHIALGWFWFAKQNEGRSLFMAGGSAWEDTGLCELDHHNLIVQSLHFFHEPVCPVQWCNGLYAWSCPKCHHPMQFCLPQHYYHVHFVITDDNKVMVRTDIFFLNCLQRSIDKMFCSKFVRLPVASALQSPDPVSNTVVELQSLSM